MDSSIKKTLILFLLILAFNFGTIIVFVSGLRCHVCSYNSDTGKDANCGQEAKNGKPCNDKVDVTDKTTQLKETQSDLEKSFDGVTGRAAGEFYCYEKVRNRSNGNQQIILRGCEREFALPPRRKELGPLPDTEIAITKNGEIVLGSVMYCVSNDTMEEEPCNNKVKHKNGAGRLSLSLNAVAAVGLSFIFIFTKALGFL